MTDEATAGLNAINRKEQSLGIVPHAYKSVPQGAATSVWAAFVGATNDVGGAYCEDCHVAEISSRVDVRGGVRPYALDADLARTLWKVSEELVGERF